MASGRRQVDVIEDETVVGGQDVAIATAPEAEAPAVVAEAEEVAAEAEAHAEEGATHCRLCNRLLTAEQSVIRGLGPVCAGHIARELGVTLDKLAIVDPEKEGFIPEEQLAQTIAANKGKRVHYVNPDDFNPEENEFPEPRPEGVPDGPMKWVRVVDVTKTIDETGRSMALFIKAFGGDRGLQEPKSWYWTPFYVGRVRYFPAEVLNHLDEIPLKRARKTREEEAPVAPPAPPVDEVDEAEAPAEPEDTEAESSASV